MRIYEKRDLHKKDVFCRTCGKSGHLWFTCDVPKKQLELRKQNKKPDFTLFSKWEAKRWNRLDSQGNIQDLDFFWSKMESSIASQVQRKTLQEANRAHKEKLYGKKIRQAPKCGFCHQKGHNRRNCKIMKDFIQDLSLANQNYRKQFYNKVVKTLGVAEGAVVSLSSKSMLLDNQWYDNWEGIGLITNISWDNVNLGIALDSWEYKGDLTVELLIEGRTHTTTEFFSKFAHNNTDQLGKIFRNKHGWYACVAEQILAPSENLPTEQWFNEGYNECWNWLTKKRDLQQLAPHMAPIIAEWHPQKNGKGSKSLNSRLRKYGYSI